MTSFQTHGVNFELGIHGEHELIVVELWFNPYEEESHETQVEYLRHTSLPFHSALHCNFFREHFQPFGLKLVLPSVVKPSGAIAKRGTRHLT